MGKYIVLATLALALILTVLANQGMRTDRDTSKSQAERQEKVLARQIALSAFDMGLAELQRDYAGWRVQRTDVPHQNGTYDLTASGPSGGPVSLIAKGHLGGETYKITGEVVQEKQVSALFNGITAVGPANFNVSGPGCGGEPCVSGLDVGGREDRKGISLPNSGNESDVCEEFEGKVEGIGGGCDVQSRYPNRDDWIESEMDKLESQIQAESAKEDSDVTVCSNCKLKGNSTESGILYVTGKATISGDAQWNGPVYVAEGGSVRINGGGRSRNINGGLVMEKNATLDMNGGNRVQYNTNKLRDYFGTLPSMSTMAVVVKDRSGGLVRSSE